MTQYRASPRLRQVRAGDELVVVDSRSGATHVLDASGALLLERLEDWTSPADLAAAYLPEAESDAGAAVEALATEVTATLEQFRMIRLVEQR